MYLIAVFFVIFVIFIVYLVVVAVPFLIDVLYYGVFGFFILYLTYHLIINIPSAVRCIKYAIFKRDGKIIGFPDITQECWDWQVGNTCAIAAQSMILNISGVQRTTDELSKIQQAYGSFSPEKGASSLRLLLDGFGIKCKEVSVNHMKFHYDLWRLFHGGNVILVTVNAHMLNNPDSDFKYDKFKAIDDHAILLTGAHWLGNVFYIFYSDTGCFDGSLKAINEKDLLNAISKKAIAIKLATKSSERFLPVGFKKRIACPSCRAKLRIPFNKLLKVNCVKCSASFLVRHNH